MVINGARGMGNHRICSGKSRGRCIRMDGSRYGQPVPGGTIRGWRKRCKPEQRQPRRRSKGKLNKSITDDKHFIILYCIHQMYAININ